MNTKRISYRETTAQQRKLLFENWEATGNVTIACRKAHVGRGTFYYWKPRFEKNGYAGLEAYESRAPKNPSRTAVEVEQKVIGQRRKHPDWGKQRIADELAKANNWVPLVTPQTVRRILKDAGLWEAVEAEAKKKQVKTSSRTAEEPGQTINVDLCFVPASHEVADKLPAVSGSSGRLKVQRSETETAEREWPGQVFENLALSYEEAMLAYVAASREKEQQPQKERHEAEPLGHGSLKTKKQVLRCAEVQLRAERRQVREQRKLEDQAWREKRLSLRERSSQLPVITAWIAILVIIDNCTRQCLGLPLFVAGAHVTAETIVAALHTLLPPELLFLISDRGTHFKAKAFKMLMLSEEFIHVLIARHRPESNGIAERFVRTLKEWLADKSWEDDQELAVLLRHFLDEYNDRPHQGLAIPGLSPNEFANRIWLM